MNFSSGDNSSFLQNLIAIVEENLGNEHFSVEELAEKLGLSRSMLHRKLKRLTGENASDFITAKRMERAKELLEKSELTAAEIAYKTGFNSPSYFNKVFKKFYQVSPGDLRKGKKISVSHVSATKQKMAASKSRKTVLIVTIAIVGVALFWLGTHYSKAKINRSEISIAILPFDNLSDVENTQYFADGVVEDLLGRLATIKDIKVISRTSSEMFREKGEKTIPEIGKLLGVSHIVEGTVQRIEDDIRISVQLIDTQTDNHVLSKQYDRNLSDFFSIQSEIAGKIASELSLALTDTELETLKRGQTKSLQAFEYYRLGRFHSSKRRVEEFFKGIEYYEKAIELDSGYAQAYAGLADNYCLLVEYGGLQGREVVLKAKELAEKALQIEPDLAEAHTVLGELYKIFARNWEKAEKELKMAVEINPSYSTAHQYYSELLSYLGRNDEARKHIDLAMKLDPYSIIIRYTSARFHHNRGELEQALEDINICLDMDSTLPKVLDLEFDIHIAMKNDSAALDCMRRLDFFGMWNAEQVDSVYQTGGIEEIKRWILSLQKVDHEYQLAIFYAQMGEYDIALDLLEQAAEANIVSAEETTYLLYKPLRSNPRFIAIREKMGLPPLEP